MNCTRFVRVLSGAVALLVASTAHGSPIIDNIGLLTPDVTITFSEHVLPSESPVTDQYEDLGVTFSPSLYYNTQPLFFPTESLANFNFMGALSNPASIFFANPVQAAAVAVQTNPGSTTFTALLNGSVVETFAAATTLSMVPDTTSASNFYGFSGIVFNQLMIQASNSYFQIDNLQYDNALRSENQTAPVPEPATLSLLGFGAATMGVRRWRQRKTT